MSVATASLTDPPTAVRALWDELVGLTEDLDEADWGRPTPCPAWTVGELITHCAAAQFEFDRSAPRPDPPPDWTPPADAHVLDAWTARQVAARSGWTPAQRLAELRTAAHGHVARVNAVEDWAAPTPGPLGETTEAGLLAVRCYDLWVHLQDLREALGLPTPAATELAAATLAYRYAADLAGWLFARRAGASEGATMALRLGAPLGLDTVLEVRDGRGRHSRGADPGVCAVTGHPAAFTLLVSGRGHPERWRELGLLDWSGPRGEEFVACARVFG